MTDKINKVLVLGITGMLGSAVFKVFSEKPEFVVYGTTRTASALRFFSEVQEGLIITGIDVFDMDSLLSVFSHVKPDLVINCVGLIKQLSESDNPLIALPINAMLPHRLSRLCEATNARLIHVSTDCVFSGKKGKYQETDSSDAEDLYGKSKYIGELHNDLHAITLRTSIIGHEQISTNALIDWFLTQEGEVKGFRKAIFTGLPTVELARVMRDFVVPNPNLYGLYHVSAQPINKFDLLTLVASQYKKKINIIPDDDLEIDRSLDSTRFSTVSGYVAPDWPELISNMYSYRKVNL